jgi:hypothetical protein
LNCFLSALLDDSHCEVMINITKIKEFIFTLQYSYLSQGLKIFIYNLRFMNPI